MLTADIVDAIVTLHSKHDWIPVEDLTAALMDIEDIDRMESRDIVRAVEATL